MDQQPAGTITFLFTDIEGSTRLWESHTDAMRVAIRRHDEILRSSIESHSGYVFKTVGDAFCAAFGAAPDAVAAAMDLQRKLRAEKWELPRPINVRTALHTGDAELRDNDYFGPSVNRSARLLSLVAGGQTVLSLVTEELVRDVLPPGTRLVDLGSHRLKDLTRPEEVFEIRDDSWDDVFPPLKSLDTHPHNLPIEPTPLVGRMEETERLEKELIGEHVRMLTLVGPGGIGKTRMSLQIAADLIDHFPDGAFVVDLSAVREPTDVATTIVRTLRIRETTEMSTGELLADWMHDRKIVLILDNFEQVIDAAPRMSALLARCANARFIFTSREPLRVRGEHVFQVRPLPTPAPGTERTSSLAELTQYDSVRLFIERAADVNPEFAVNEENAPAIAEICARVDGLPLAIELAAARTSVLPPESLLRHLSQRLKTLTRGPRDLPARQQTLRDAIAWSYDLLPDLEKRFFEAISVFSDGFTFNACERVCAGYCSETADPLSLIQALAEKSLLVPVVGDGNEDRFRILETIREFGLSVLAPGQERDNLERNHAEYYRDLSTAMQPKLEGVRQAELFATLDSEIGNIRAAADFLERSGRHLEALSMIVALGEFWKVRGIIQEPRTRIGRLLSQREHSADATRFPARLAGESYLLLGRLAREGRAYDEAARWFGQAMTVSTKLRDEKLSAAIMYEHSWLHFRSDEFTKAEEQCREGLKHAELARDGLVRAKLEMALASCRIRKHETEGVRELLQKARALFHEEGYLSLESQALGNLGMLAERSGELHAAREHIEKCVPVFEQLRDTHNLAIAFNNLGALCLRLGDCAKALEYYQRLGPIASRVRSLEVFASAGVAESEVCLGNAEGALMEIERTFSILDPRADAESVQGYCCLIRAEVLMSAGRLASAHQSFSEAVRLLEHSGDPIDVERARNGLASTSHKNKH